MAADLGSIFSRDEVLGGMPARRASTLLYAIEARTALLSARARRAMARFETERTAAEHEQEFLSALAEGRDSAVVTTIQELDRHADRWAGLVPAEPALRAEILRRIVDKYGLPAQATSVRAALGADDPAVAAAYAERAGKPLGAAEAAPLSARERFRWWRASASRRLESLPPFWLAFTLTLTETVGGGVLALPIAFAGFGPVGATVLLIVFGILNTLTIAALVESITRDGAMRYGDSFIGRLIRDYLGRPGLAIAVPTLLVLETVGFSVALIGFGTTVGGVTGMPVVLWAAVLFGVVTAILWRGTIDATVAVAVAVGSINLVLLLAISAIAFLNARPDAFAGSGTGLSLDASVLELVFGVALVAYFGHTSAGHSAKVVLARDPSGRHLLSGNIAAMLTAMVIYVVFVLVVTGAVGATELAGYTGTALTPLAQKIGPIIEVLGTIYIVLAVGLSAVHVGLGLYNQMADLIASTPLARLGARADGESGEDRRLQPARGPAAGHLRHRRSPPGPRLDLVHRAAERRGHAHAAAARRGLPDAHPGRGTPARRAAPGPCHPPARLAGRRGGHRWCVPVRRAVLRPVDLGGATRACCRVAGRRHDRGAGHHELAPRGVRAADRRRVPSRDGSA